MLVRLNVESVVVFDQFSELSDEVVFMRAIDNDVREAGHVKGKAPDKPPLDNTRDCRLVIAPQFTPSMGPARPVSVLLVILNDNVVSLDKFCRQLGM